MAFDTKAKRDAAIAALEALKKAFNGKYALPQEIKDKNDAETDPKRKKIYPKDTLWIKDSNQAELEGKSEEEQEKIKQDQEERKQKIKDASGQKDDGDTDQDKLDKTLKNFKNDINRRTEIQSEKEKEDEIKRKQDEQIKKNERLAQFDCYDFDAYFKADLENTIKQQVEDWHGAESFEIPDEEYMGGKIIMPGDWIEQDELDTPVIAMFIDTSGSFNQKLRELSENTIEYILHTYEFKETNEPPELHSAIYYFGDHIEKTAFNPDTNHLLSPNHRGGGTGAFQEIIDEIRRINATDVLFFTDFDLIDQCKPSYTVEIPGVCWWLYPDSVLKEPNAKDWMDRQGRYVKTTDPTNSRRYIVPADKMYDKKA